MGVIAATIAQAGAIGNREGGGGGGGGGGGCQVTSRDSSHTSSGPRGRTRPNGGGSLFWTSRERCKR